MAIIKKLKNAIFIWDDDKQIFSVWVWNKNDNRRIGININKIYAVSFSRFVIRILTNNFYRCRKRSHEKKN